ncbi:MAG: hypothetical protein QOE70_1695 [Chthoniobacter sp.]|jgi:hypothetical protein|nr:hypothetical protein [Chthoniobacter sp.]
METLQILGTALGLATLAGLNLYLTVFVTGLAIQQHWINVAQTYPQLTILAHPAIIAISGVLFLLQFFADKVPWVDSLWDTVHTLIRPIGGAFLAIRVLGTPDPVFDVIAALLGGSVSLMVHSVKAGTRLVANHSPEPFSNIALSVTEDATVLGGLALIWYDPKLALIVFSIVLLCIVYFGPKLFRAVKVNAWLFWQKLTAPAVDQLETELPKSLPHELEIAGHSADLLGEKIVWAVPCVSSATRRIPANLFGYLIATEGEPTKLAFIAKRRWRKAAEQLDLATYKIAHEPKFLSENVVLYSLEKKPKFVFLFARSQRPVVKAIAAWLRERLEPASTLPRRNDELQETVGTAVG